MTRHRTSALTPPLHRQPTGSDAATPAVRKGFTLVEMIAAIVVISIVGLVGSRLVLVASNAMEGTARRASLTLNSPLGTRLARMQWDATSATLEVGDQKRSFESVDAMSTHTLGSALPMQALFAWLQGRPETAPGWEIQTLDMLQGRIRARSVDRTPAVQIDLVLEPR